MCFAGRREVMSVRPAILDVLILAVLFVLAIPVFIVLCIASFVQELVRVVRQKKGKV